MAPKQVWKLFRILIVISGMSSNIFADTTDDPCGGPSALLNIVDRPTIGDSACVLKFFTKINKKAML